MNEGNDSPLVDCMDGLVNRCWFDGGWLFVLMGEDGGTSHRFVLDENVLKHCHPRWIIESPLDWGV